MVSATSWGLPVNLSPPWSFPRHATSAQSPRPMTSFTRPLGASGTLADGAASPPCPLLPGKREKRSYSARISGTGHLYQRIGFGPSFAGGADTPGRIPIFPNGGP